MAVLEESGVSPSLAPSMAHQQEIVSEETTRCTSDSMYCSVGEGFPQELDLFSFSAEEHTLTVTATDAAGQPSSYEYTFFGIPELDLACSYDSDANTLICEGNNDIVSSTCVFDGGEGAVAAQCSLPLEIRLTGLRLGRHNVTVTASDQFGQTESAFHVFEFALGAINVSIPETASVIEGKMLSPVMFSISGQALSAFPFSVSPLTYTQFETQTGLSVNSLFTEEPPPSASLSKQLGKPYNILK